jgi:UDP-N-acetylglucosamine--dolichyl-phosphate N-acetylglucosaminephosphotransferase
MDHLTYLLMKSSAHWDFIAIFLVGFLTTLIYTPKLIQKAYKKGLTVKDMYKREKPDVPNYGGLAILAGILCSLIVSQFVLSEVAQVLNIELMVLVFYFMVFSFAMFGLMDDLLDVGQKSKIYIPFFLALPIALLISTKAKIAIGSIVLLDPTATITIAGTTIGLNLVYAFIIAPIYVMVVSNLINMHSGFNGLSCGLSYILLVFTVIKVVLVQQTYNMPFILPLFGAILAFLYFETYPARIFWGNVGSLMVGAAVGGFIVLNNLEVFGIFIMIPHIINFLMYVVWKIKKVGDVKFGKVRDDGTLEVPNPLTLKWLFPYYYRLTEKQSMEIMYMVTVIFGIIGLLIIH